MISYKLMEDVHVKLWQRKEQSVPLGPIRLMYHVYRYILPEVRLELKNWKQIIAQIPDEELRQQANASMHSKQFHCEGGAVYALANLSMRHQLIPLIVAFQTISDYLDNLCDRSTSLDPVDFRQLHQSMLDAIKPHAPLQDYYAYHLEKDDGGYLASLVIACQRCIRQLPSYEVTSHEIEKLVKLYIDLQVYKHIHHDLREQQLDAWWHLHQLDYPDLRWNEFAAATGSTLGVFMLFQAASQPHTTLAVAQHISEAYFPYVCGLHILLDYLIDQSEDMVGGDLNFCQYYIDQDMTSQRITHIAEQARTRIEHLPHVQFHSMIIDGLLALYLSDPKVNGQAEVKRISTKLLNKKTSLTRLFFFMNSKYIRTQS
jgi:tetraprenyl-beta-curcumene synthase